MKVIIAEEEEVTVLNTLLKLLKLLKRGGRPVKNFGNLASSCGMMGGCL